MCSESQPPTQKQRGDACRNTPPQHTIKSNTSPPAWMQSAAQMRRPMKGFRRRAEWHISTFHFFLHTLTFHWRSDFLSEPPLCPGLLASTNLHLEECQSWEMLGGRGCKMKGWSNQNTPLLSLQCLSCSRVHLCVSEGRPISTCFN